MKRYNSGLLRQRSHAGLTQKELAENAGINIRLVQKYL